MKDLNILIYYINQIYLVLKVKKKFIKFLLKYKRKNIFNKRIEFAKVNPEIVGMKKADRKRFTRKQRQIQSGYIFTACFLRIKAPFIFLVLHGNKDIIGILRLF